MRFVREAVETLGGQRIALDGSSLERESLDLGDGYKLLKCGPVYPDSDRILTIEEEV